MVSYRKAILIIIVMLLAVPVSQAGDSGPFTRMKKGGKEKDPNITSWRFCVKPLMNQQKNTADFWMCTMCIKDKKLNYGIYWKPSKECIVQELKDNYNKLVAVREEFMDESLKRNEKLCVPMEYVRTHHFLIGWNIKEIPCSRQTKVKYGLNPKPPKLTMHEAIHIYAMRAEDCWDHHCRDFKMERMSEKDITEVYWLKTKKQKETVVKNHHHYKGSQINRIVVNKNPAIWELLKNDWRHDEQTKFTHVHLIG
ncbi:hypothetical protein ACFL54_03670, partial [Planctomycetota bacterium]